MPLCPICMHEHDAWSACMIFGTPINTAFGIEFGGIDPPVPEAAEVTAILQDYERLQQGEIDRRARKAASQRRFRSNYTKTKA